MKRLSFLLIGTLLAVLVGCGEPSDPLETLYTMDVLPGNTGGDIGARGNPYGTGWFDNLYLKQLYIDGTAFPPANGDTTMFLRGDYAWAVPPAGGSLALDDLTDVNAPAPTDSQVLTYDDGTATWVAENATGGGYTDEQAQDAVGTILTNSGSVYFTYNDGAPSITATANITTGTSTNITGLLKGSGATISAATAGTDYLVSPLTADLNFAEYKAIALVCDNGATVPAGPTKGQWYLHTPTGRNVLMQYDGSNWIPIISLGAMTVYVDNTDGTDSVDKGGAVDAGAVKTVQYAVNLIPGLVGGNVVINVNAEAYAQDVTIQGKSLTGAYTITLQGTLTAGDNLVASGAGVKGATSTQPSWTDTGLTASAYANKLLKFTSGANNGLYRVVDSNTTTVITFCGPTLSAQPALNDTATVYDWGTSIQSITITNTQVGIKVNDIKCTGTSPYPFNVKLNSIVMEMNRCCATGAGIAGLYIPSGAKVDVQNQCAWLTTGSYGIFAGTGAWTLMQGTKIAGYASGGGSGIRGELLAMVYLSGGNVINGGSAATQKGVDADNTAVLCYSPDVYNFIRNNQAGVSATGGAEVTLTAYNSYSGNTANESATAASYSYID